LQAGVLFSLGIQTPLLCHIQSFPFKFLKDLDLLAILQASFVSSHTKLDLDTSIAMIEQAVQQLQDEDDHGTGNDTRSGNDETTLISRSI
jgi:hypothetical protein